MLNLNGKFQLNTDVCCGDKSISHRALILASVANGTSVITNLSLCQDVKATACCLRKLGAKIEIDGTTATVTPIRKPLSNVVLDCKNSGTTARLLAGLVAGLGVSATFVGDESLSKRPMDRVIEPLKKMGAQIHAVEGGLFRVEASSLVGTKIEAAVNSAQVKSAVLIAGLFAKGETTYVEKLPTRNHTELMLASLGAKIDVVENVITVRQSRLFRLDLDVPNDPSSVAYLAATALLSGQNATFTNVLLNERRTGFYRLLKRSGCNIEFVRVHNVCGEAVGDIIVRESRFEPVYANERDVCDAIDELPLLACMCLTAQGTSEFAGVSELKHKECDRIQAIRHIADVCGQQALFDGENLKIISDGKLPSKPNFTSFCDHRIAMCQTVLAILCGGGSVDETPFDVSYPSFLTDLGVRPLKLGLIGQSVANSKSPVLMRTLASRANVCCSYKAISLDSNISDEELLSVIRSFDGLNVTMPFKRRVAELLSAECPAVNTVGKNAQPSSTDGYGIVTALQQSGADFANKPLWIVGAGGAAEECVRTLLPYGCKIQIVNRTEQHARELSAKYNLQEKIDEPYGVLSFVPECEFEQSLKLPASCKFVFVAAYKGASGLRRQALERGVTYVDGLQMLYYQGAKSFALWTGTELQNDYESFLKAVTDGKTNKR